MPGPFPGMDPYLEDPVYWPDIHQSLISAIRGQLNSRLPDNYVAHTGERIIIETRERDVYPDLTVFQRRDGQSGTGGGLLLADPYTRITVLPSEMREPFIEVIAIKPHRAVVATIEVLSPANKRTGTDGRSSYLEKQSALLSSEIHLVEIDLLRTGAHTVAAPEARIAALGRHDYRICVHRANRERTYTNPALEKRLFDLWTATVRDRLPSIFIPLSEGDPDVVLDLQPCLDRTYDEGRYQGDIDYSSDPPVPLPPDDASWADALLREKGLRPPAAG